MVRPQTPSGMSIAIRTCATKHEWEPLTRALCPSAGSSGEQPGRQWYGKCPGGSRVGCKTTELAQVLLDTNTQFWPNAEYAKHRGVTRMKVGVLATMIL